jgi:hypothetical protein
LFHEKRALVCEGLFTQGTTKKEFSEKKFVLHHTVLGHTGIVISEVSPDAQYTSIYISKTSVRASPESSRNHIFICQNCRPGRLN